MVEIGPADAGRAQVVACFRSLDSNGDGFVDKGDLTKILQKLDKTWPEDKAWPEWPTQILKMVAVAKNGRIAVEDFIEWAFTSSDCINDVIEGLRFLELQPLASEDPQHYHIVEKQTEDRPGTTMHSAREDFRTPQLQSPTADRKWPAALDELNSMQASTALPESPTRADEMFGEKLSSVSEAALADQLAVVQEVWLASVDHMLTLMGQRMQALQKESARKTGAPAQKSLFEAPKWLESDSLRAENDHLRAENDSLRARLQNCCNGDALPPTPQESRAAPTAQSFSETMHAKPAPVQAMEPEDAPPPLDIPGCIGNDAAAPPGDDELDQQKAPLQHVSSRRKSIRETALVTPGKAVFPDAEAMKEKIRLDLAKKEYNVSEFYWETGFAQELARHAYFETVTLGVISFNALWISIDSDLNKAALLNEAHPVFQIAEHSFCIYFTFEWLVRFLAFKSKRNCVRDAWFIFDSALVMMMISETWLISIIVALSGEGASSFTGNTAAFKLVRLVRLARMGRMARLLREIPELLVLIKGIWIACRSVFFTLVLLTIILYLFAITFRQLTDGSSVGDHYFPTVPEAMLSLFLDGVIPDQAQILRDNFDEYWALGVLALLFILLASLTVMNMLLGVLVETIGVVSCVEKEQIAVVCVKESLMSMFSDEMECITRDEFHMMLMNPHAEKVIHRMGVDVAGLVDFEDFIFKETEQLSFADFMQLLLQLRGTNSCTVKDIVDLRKSAHKDFMNLHSEIEGGLKRLSRQLDAIMKDGSPLRADNVTVNVS